jgi:5-enolpyruvylshikimate-3-phosphate synthase
MLELPVFDPGAPYRKCSAEKYTVPGDNSRFRYFLGTRELSKRSDYCTVSGRKIDLW